MVNRLSELDALETFPVVGTSISPKTIDELSSVLSSFESPDEAFLALGTGALKLILEDNDPNLVEYLNYGRNELDTEPGCFILKRTGIDRLSVPLAQLTAIAVSSFFGKPIEPSPRSPVIAWPIDYTKEVNTPGVTFSQTSAEAPLHTDTQYFLDPEPYFGLFCIIPANDGGGISQVVDSRVVLSDMAETDGQETVYELTKPYPFKVPNIFKKDLSDPNPEVTWAPIISPKGIRYRKDTLADALRLENISLPPQQLHSLQKFEEALERSQIYEYSLEAGDVIFINNHRILHGRTAFEDSNRLMLRVRVR